MQHLIQPNRWTCTPTSFAMACDVSLEKILEIIGHDGSSIVHPHLREPFCRRSFHLQECIWAAYSLGFSITPFESFPVLAATEVDTLDLERPWNRSILAGFGVLTGRGRTNRHAIAFNAYVGYDPNGTTVDLIKHPDDRNYTIETVWKFDFRNQSS